MNNPDRCFTMEDIFNIVHNALSPFYSNKTVNVEQEDMDGETERLEVPELEFIMHAIGQELSPINGWTEEVEDVLGQMHKALDDRDYQEFTFSLEKPTALVSYSRGGGRRKTRKSRKSHRRN
jgi:hypothetical protein